MKRFEIFRTKDPQVSTWLQKNGFQNRRSNSYEVRGVDAAQKITGKIEKDTQTKEVRFHLDKSMYGKIPKCKGKTLTSRSGRMVADSARERMKLNTHEIPMTILSQDVKPVLYGEKTEIRENSFNLMRGSRMRSFSNPFNNGFDDHVPVMARVNIAGRPSLRRSYSTFSVSSERPSNIPVLIRNNNTRLRKYSCPENHTRTPQKEGRREIKESERDGFGKEPMVFSSNATPGSRHEFLNKTAHNVDARKVARGKLILEVQTLRGGNKYAAERRKDDPLRTGMNSSNLHVATDLNGNYISVNPSRPITLSDSSGSKELGLKLYEEDSLQSYSIEMQPKSLNHNFPSSMYNTRGNMLSWLGEVNRNNPQLWS